MILCEDPTLWKTVTLIQCSIDLKLCTQTKKQTKKRNYNTIARPHSPTLVASEGSAKDYLVQSQRNWLLSLYTVRLLASLKPNHGFGSEVLGGLVSKFGILSQAVTSVWVRLPPVAMLWICPYMTLAVGLETTHKL